MEALKCDVCGGKLVMNAGGKEATCEYCGMTYSLERVREKVQEIKGTVSISGTVQARQTGTEEDVQQWKQLLRKYINDCDYRAALSVAKKILEAVPSDLEANNVYDSLRKLQYFDIRDGVLVKYNGREKCVKVPEGVKAIGRDAFNGVDIEEIILSDSVETINGFAFGYDEFEADRPDWAKVRFRSKLRNVIFGKGLKYIDEYAFCGCPFLWELAIPESINEIGKVAFPIELKRLVLPLNYEKGAECLFNCEYLETIDASASFIENVRIASLNENNELRNPIPLGGRVLCRFSYSPYRQKILKEKQCKQWRNSNLCQYCGGSFKGILSKTCSKCGRPKDY